TYRTETYVSRLVFGKVYRRLGEPDLSSVLPFILTQTVREKLKEARASQKSYADKHRRSLEFQPGDHVFLKVSPARGVRRFGIKDKLSPHFIGPFEILYRVGEVSYRLALPPQLSHVHNISHVSLLRGIMKKKTIPFIKILWRNHPEREATWETEESIRTSYPHFLP
nr:hypothetical protein [Tanacetum cinerariifolium]